MPAATTDNILLLPHIPLPDATAVPRPVTRVVTAITTLEGEGFQVCRPFPAADMNWADPFLLLDHLGAVEYAPGEAKGAPGHPHRGFEPVTYVIDGATQWMTAGAGILHDEMPPEQLVVKGGLFHGVQLRVNLLRELTWAPPRYQEIGAGKLTLLSSGDGGALVRLIAGALGNYQGPGVTWTPITYAHATLSPGARLELSWRPDFNGLVSVLPGRGSTGEGRPISEGEPAVFGAGDTLTVTTDRVQNGRLPTTMPGGRAPSRPPSSMRRAGRRG